MLTPPSPEKSMNGSSNMRGAGREGRTIQGKTVLFQLVVIVFKVSLGRGPRERYAYGRRQRRRY